MNREEQFIDYLGKLKNEGNAELLENVISGFKTLVEYRVGGSIAERQVDIMESEDEIDVDDSLDEEVVGDLDTPLDESSIDIKDKIYGKDSDEARNARYIEDQRENMKKGIHNAANNLSAAIEMWNRQNESYGKPKNVIGRKGEKLVKSTDSVMESAKRFDTLGLIESINHLSSLLSNFLLEGISAPKFNEDPIIPDAISVISSHPEAIEFTDKDTFDSFLEKQKYFSASYSHCFYSVEEMEEFRRTFTPVNSDCVILRETGRLLVAVWDAVNGIGYIIPANVT